MNNERVVSKNDGDTGNYLTIFIWIVVVGGIILLGQYYTSKFRTQEPKQVQGRHSQ
jgi:hypothetical protein